MSGSRIRIAQIGCGHWGRNLVRNFAELEVLAAVTDGNSEVAAQYAHAHAVPARSFDDILGDPEIDAVALATPAATHAEMAGRAVAAGKHVYIEKPLALDIARAEALLEAAERHRRIVMVGHLLQYHPIFLELKRLVAEGALGRLRYVYSNRLSLGKFRTEENVLWSFAPHDISMLIALTGEAPFKVSAEGADFVTPGIADWSICHLRFPSGVRGHVQSSWLHPFKEHRLVVVGDSAMAVFEDSVEDWDRRLAIYRHGVDYRPHGPVPLKGEADYVKVPRGEPLRNECEHFVDCIRSGSRPRTDGLEGLRVLAVLSQAETQLSASLSAREISGD